MQRWEAILWQTLKDALIGALVGSSFVAVVLLGMSPNPIALLVAAGLGGSIGFVVGGTMTFFSAIWRLTAPRSPLGKDAEEAARSHFVPRCGPAAGQPDPSIRPADEGTQPGGD